MVVHVFLLSVAFTIVIAEEEYFRNAVQNCYEFNFFEKLADISLIHCGLECFIRYECNCLSYNKKTGECKLHNFLASTCTRNATDNYDTVTLETNKTGVDCVFETLNEKSGIRGIDVDLADKCGNDTIKSPMVFEVKGDGLAGISLEKSKIYQGYTSVFYIGFSFWKDSCVINLSELSTFFARSSKIGFRDVYTFWMIYEWQTNGNFKFQMGEGLIVGNGMFFDESITIELAHVSGAVVQSADGKCQWKFILQA